jgi:hypothetical protein
MDHPDGTLTRSVVYNLIEQLGGVCCNAPKRSRADLWLESPGGDAHAAYKLAVYLRTKFESVTVVVPDFAKSAATLLALAGDNIVMGRCAELGPLDMQEAREGEVHLRSALDTANSIEALFQRAINNAIVGGSHILVHTRLSREKTLKSTLEFAASFFQPLVQQLDPLAIYAAGEGLRVTVEYGARLLESRIPGLSKDRAREQVGALVTGYPTHGFIIDRAHSGCGSAD